MNSDHNSVSLASLAASLQTEPSFSFNFLLNALGGRGINAKLDEGTLL